MKPPETHAVIQSPGSYDQLVRSTCAPNKVQKVLSAEDSVLDEK